MTGLAVFLTLLIEFLLQIFFFILILQYFRALFNISLFPAVLFDMCRCDILFIYFFCYTGLLSSGSSFSSVCFSSRFSAAGPIFSLRGLKNFLCVPLRFKFQKVKLFFVLNSLLCYRYALITESCKRLNI